MKTKTKKKKVRKERKGKGMRLANRQSPGTGGWKRCVSKFMDDIMTTMDKKKKKNREKSQN